MKASMQPADRAFLGRGIDINYARFKEDVDRISRHFLRLGIGKSDRVLLAMNPTYLHVVILIALDRLGVTSMSNNFFKEEAQSTGISLILGINPGPQNTGIRFIALPDKAMPVDFAGESTGRQSLPNDLDAQCVTRLIRSSGTTGQAKIIALTRDSMMKRVYTHHMMVEGAGTNRYLLTMPPGTIGGYGFLLTAIQRGATLVPWVANSDFMALIDAYQVSHLLLSPLALKGIVTRATAGNLTFPSVKAVTTGGAPFDARLTRAALRVLGTNISNGYASTEAGSVARGNISLTLEDPQLIGPVLPFVRLEIVDDKDQPLSPGTPGKIRIQSYITATGYLDPADDEGVFRDGWFYPGDLGSLDDNGILRVHGREDGVINISGKKMIAEELERKVMQLEGVRGAAIFTVERLKQMWLAVEIHPGSGRQNVEANIRKHLGDHFPFRLLVVDELPRNDMGKLSRPDLPGLVEDESRKPAAE